MGRKTLDSNRGDYAARPFGIRMATGGGLPGPHAPTHESGGVDALNLGNIAGVITDAQHGNRGGGTLHTLVTPDPGGVAGFMSPADKAKLDAIAGTGRVFDYQYGRNTIVPGGGLLQLQGPGPTLTAIRMLRPGIISAASIEVGVIDAGNTYDLQIRLNGAPVQTVTLAAGTLGAQAVFGAPTAVVAGDLVTAFMVRTAGVGASAFSDMQAVVEVTS